MSAKTSQLQIRVSPEQKATLKRLASEAGVSVSTYVLSTVLPSGAGELGQLVEGLLPPEGRRVALRALRIHLAGLTAAELAEAEPPRELATLPAILRNYVAAAVEHEARARGVEPPRWALDVAPPERPHFAWETSGLRTHLIRITPAAFKRRNVFVDADGLEGR